MSAKSLGKALGYTLGLSVWAVVSIVLGQFIAALCLSFFAELLDAAVEATVLAALGYTFAVLTAIGMPYIVWRRLPSRKVLGVTRLPSWTDIGLGITSVVPYFLISAVTVWIGMDVLKLIQPEVGQDIPFENLTLQYEYVVAFITLVVLAPVAEEFLIRGYFLGKLSEKSGKIIALFVTSIVFGLLHLPGGSDAGIVLQWGAAFDTFAMGLAAGALRLLTGNIWAGVLLHSIKNGIAYYFLFINPLSPMG